MNKYASPGNGKRLGILGCSSTTPCAARRSHGPGDQGVVGSNPAAPTSKIKWLTTSLLPRFLFGEHMGSGARAICALCWPWHSRHSAPLGIGGGNSTPRPGTWPTGPPCPPFFSRPFSQQPPEDLLLQIATRRTKLQPYATSQFRKNPQALRDFLHLLPPPPASLAPLLRHSAFPSFSSLSEPGAALANPLLLRLRLT